MSFRSNHAFTIPELLVATTVASALIVVLGQLTTRGLDVLQTSKGKMEKEQDARYFLDRFTFELKASRTSDNLRFESKNFESITFFSPYINDENGDLCGMNYYWKADSFELRKNFLDSRNAYNASYDFDSDSASPLNVPVLRNVLNIKIECLQLKAPKDGEEPTTDEDLLYEVKSPWNKEDGRPDRIRVSFTLVDEATARKLEVLSPSSDAFEKVAMSGSKTFTKEIALTK